MAVIVKKKLPAPKPVEGTLGRTATPGGGGVLYTGVPKSRAKPPTPPPPVAKKPSPAQAVTDPRAYGQGKAPKPVVRAAGMGRSLHGDPKAAAGAKAARDYRDTLANKLMGGGMRTQPMPPPGMGMTKGPGMKMQPAAKKTAGFGKRKR